MTKEQAKDKILDLIAQASNLIPQTLEPDLETTSTLTTAPAWRQFELSVWEIGEQIRQITSEHISLRKDTELLDKIIEICINRNAKSGRQSFIMLLWFKHCEKYSGLLVKHLDDVNVRGHIIQGLNKMQANGYGKLIEPFTSDKTTWVKKQAKLYIEKFGD